MVSAGSNTRDFYGGFKIFSKCLTSLADRSPGSQLQFGVQQRQLEPWRAPLVASPPRGSPPFSFSGPDNRTRLVGTRRAGRRGICHPTQSSWGLWAPPHSSSRGTIGRLVIVRRCCGTAKRKIVEQVIDILMRSSRRCGRLLLRGGRAPPVPHVMGWYTGHGGRVRRGSRESRPKCDSRWAGLGFERDFDLTLVDLAAEGWGRRGARQSECCSSATFQGNLKATA